MSNVLLISNSLIPSVLLCGHFQLQYLSKQKKINYKFASSRRIKKKVIDWADIIVFVRSESSVEKIIAQELKGIKHLVYVLDDDLLNLPDYVSSAKYYKIPRIHNNIISIMNSCDSFLTTSRVLLEKYGKGFKNAFLIDEPSLQNKVNNKDNEKVKIGFAGSIDRAQDINVILEETIKEIINKYKDSVEIEFMGAKPTIVDEYKLNYIPYQDSYQKYIEKMSELNWDIGLAPMPISDFHSCKYINKYVEYASFGIAGIYSNCAPYIYGIRNGENGLLVDNKCKDWVEAISSLIDSKKLREKISDNAVKEAKTKYSLETLSYQYLDCIMKDYDETKVNKASHILLDLELFSVLLVDEIKVQRFRFPFWCVKYISLKILEALGIIEKKANNDDLDS